MSQATDIIRNPVIRDGISQIKRRPDALDPSTILIDERTLEDFLVFTLELSKRIYYYDYRNNKDLCWENFWKYDPTVVIAAIEKTNPLPAKNAFDEVSDKVPTVAGLRNLVVQTLNVAFQINNWHKELLQGSAFQVEIKRYISANLKSTLVQLFTYETGAGKLFPGYPPVNREDYSKFSIEWDKIPEDPDSLKFEPLFRPEPPINEENPAKCFDNYTDLQKLTAAYSGLKELFTGVYNIYFQIIRISPVYFQDSLKRTDHPAHLTLFVTFLQLYRQVQDDLNRMTKRHLDFYYKDALQLKSKEAVPDKVHLFFELAKNRTEHELEGGIHFKAGKDTTGNEMFYALDKTTVLNTAKVESLRTVFLSTNVTGDSKTVNKIYAAPVANSADGEGGEFKDEEKPSWATLGNDSMPEAEIGFAIASNELLLAEGTRKVSVNIYYHSSEEVSLAGITFDLSLSGEKEWFAPVESPVDIIPHTDGNDPYFTIEFTLGPDKPAVVPFNSEALKENLGTDLPVLKIKLLNKILNGVSSYEKLRNITIEKIVITVDVTGINKVMAFNDEGAVDTSKPFLPFTASPKVGSSFYTGNAEVFQKNLSVVTLKFNWGILPDIFSNYHYAGYNASGVLDCASLKVKIFSIGSQEFSTDNEDDKKEIFKCPGENSDLNDEVKPITIASSSDLPLGNLLPQDKVSNYGKDDKVGFLRLDLQDDFKHDLFQQVLIRQMLAVSIYPNILVGAYYWISNKPTELTVSGVTSEKVVIPKPPYTPSLKSITLDYTSSVSLDDLAKSGTTIFIHLHPFADTYQHFNKVADIPLLPQFGGLVKKTVDEDQSIAYLPGERPVWGVRAKSRKHLPDNVMYIRQPSPSQAVRLEEGALLIGLKNLKPRQSLSLLFQMAENTADADSPKATIHWYYLSSNEWIPFEEYQIISDTTDGLLTSGIIEFTIPDGINQENTIIPSDLHWLKAAVNDYPAAVSETVNIHAQAARVTFQNNQNDLIHLSVPLPAGTITKPETDDAAVKGINQLYDSFAGMPPENDLNFYTRVSERLRHKGRAITFYDYERLVLEAFPSIYKVKCINHTNREGKLSPGHVLLSVVPDFSKLKAVDRFRPKVTLAMLEKIKAYLEERNCCFISGKTYTLDVLNPDYEDIDFDFQVRFTSDITAIDYYIIKLKEAIVRFLSPWAYENDAEINFGGKVYKSTILSFVERQTYVDYVTDFKMMHKGSMTDVSFIEADTPRSILVPVTAEEMNIRAISADNYCNMKNRISKEALGYQTLGGTEISE